MNDIAHSIGRFALIGGALAVALAASGGAQAHEVIGAMERSDGGEILLTNGKCGRKGKGRVTLATNVSSAVSHVGCAYPFRPDRVLVKWQVGSSGSSVLAMSGWAPSPTDRSLKSFSPDELAMLFVRTAWFEGRKETKPKATPAPRDLLADPPPAGTSGKFLIYDQDPGPAPILAGTSMSDRILGKDWKCELCEVPR